MPVDDLDRIDRFVGAVREFLVPSRAVYEIARSIGGAVTWAFIEDPDLTTSYEILGHLQRCGISRTGIIENALAGLMVEGGERDAEVGFHDIGAIRCSKGRFIGNLSRLWPTSDTICRLKPSAENFAMIRRQVWTESGCVRNGRFHLYEENWSGRLIAPNSGTARRIAWLNYNSYLDETQIPARITTFVLDRTALKVLTESYWVALLPSEDGAWELSTKLEKIGVRGVESIGTLASPACPDADDGTRWSMLACDRACRRYADIRLGLMDSGTPIFDVSQWLMAIGRGRKRP